MPDALALGPFVVPTLRVGTLVALLLVGWGLTRRAERLGLDARWVATTAEGALLLGIVGARLGFALRHAIVYESAYESAPWTVLYLWQPGYSLLAGAATGGAFALWRLQRLPRGARAAPRQLLGAGFGAALLLVGGLQLATRLDLGGERLRAGDPVPAVHLHDLQGRPVTLAELRGRVVVLNFWATWCPPCRREMPTLDALHRRYADAGAVIVGVDVGEGAEITGRFVREVGVDYPIWVDGPPGGPPRGGAGGFHDTRALHAAFGGVGLPTTAFIDRDGVLRGVVVGELSAGVVQQRIEALLGRRE